VILPVEVSMKFTGSGAVPTCGLAVNDATGAPGGGAVTVTEIEAEAWSPPLSVTDTVIVWVPIESPAG
jgi:hypothetical protein